MSPSLSSSRRRSTSTSLRLSPLSPLWTRGLATTRNSFEAATTRRRATTRARNLHRSRASSRYLVLSVSSRHRRAAGYPPVSSNINTARAAVTTRALEAR